MTEQRHCDQCGARLSVGLRFCEQCGRPLAGSVLSAHGVGAPHRAAAGANSRAADGTLYKLAPAAALLLAVATAGWWFLGSDAGRSGSPPLPSPAVALPPESPPTQALPPPASTQVEFDPALAAAQQRRDAAFSRYTRIAVGEIAGDIDAAREEYRLALEELEAAERAAGRPPR